MSNLAIVPARLGSKRLPRKNIRPFFGKPILVYSVEQARRSGLFDDIIVSTESEEIREICEGHGIEIPFMRPTDLATDSAQLVDVVRHVLDTCQASGKSYDNFCILWATAPLRTATHICEAYALLSDRVEAVIGTTTYKRSVFSAMVIEEDGWLSPLFPDRLRSRRVEQPDVVVDNGSLCWVRTSAFREHGTWLPPKIKGYEMPRHCSQDIDDVQDWEAAEYFYQRYVLGRTV